MATAPLAHTPNMVVIAELKLAKSNGGKEDESTH